MYNTGSRLTRASPAFLFWRCAFARRLGRCTDSWVSSAVARPEVRAPRPRSAEPQDDGNMAGVQASPTGLPYSEEVKMYSKTGGKDFRTLLNTLHLFLVEKKQIVIINSMLTNNNWDNNNIIEKRLWKRNVTTMYMIILYTYQGSKTWTLGKVDKSYLNCWNVMLETNREDKMYR